MFNRLPKLVNRKQYQQFQQYQQRNIRLEKITPNFSDLEKLDGRVIADIRNKFVSTRNAYITEFFKSRTPEDIAFGDGAITALGVVIDKIGKLITIKSIDMTSDG